ncbi:MAG: MFS transporter [Chloroflexi bacterium]|nr:MFS transporter [Chloroflexota bacterium]
MNSNWKKVFFTVWAGQSLSLIGSHLIHFAIAWWLTQETGSAAVLVSVSLFAVVPEVVLGPFIGALVDRWNRRRIMILADTVIALFTLWLAVMFMTGRFEIWYLYVVTLIRSILGVFHYTAMTASTSLMVPKDQLGRVAGMNQTLAGILSIATPPLGALLLGILPLWGIMFIDVATAAVAVFTLLIVQIPQPEVSAEEAARVVTPRTVLVDVREGLRYVWSYKGMVIVLGMAAMINLLLSPTGTLTPLLITNHFDGGVWHLGAFESSFGFGFIAGGLILSAWGGFNRKILTSMFSLLLMGAAILIVGITPAGLFWLALAGNALTGVLNPLVNGPLFAMLQERIPPEKQGRVFTLVRSLSGLMTPIGLALAAPVADNLGVQVWWWIGGAVTILMAVFALMTPAVMNIEADMDRVQKAAAQAAASGAEEVVQPIPAD